MTATEQLIGKVVEGKFRIVEFIGRGATGNVYRAHQDSINRDVAIKLLNMNQTAHPKKVERFVQEARIQSQMMHENIAQVYSAGTLPEGQPYLVCEFVTGKTLADLLREQTKLGAPTVVPIAKQICAALEAAHALGIVHRDLKPSNIILCEKDERLVVKLIDFGTAKVMSEFRRDDMEYRSLTMAGTMIGTPAYMSPEEIQGQDVDHRADIYAFGCVLFEMFTGDVPFDGTSEYDVFKKHLESPLPTMTGIPVKFAHLISKCLAKKADDRFENVSQIKGILSNDCVTSDLVQTASRASVSPPPAPPVSSSARLPSAILNVAIGLLVLVIGGILVWRAMPKAPPTVKPIAGSPAPVVPQWSCNPFALPQDCNATLRLTTIDQQADALERYLKGHPGFHGDVEHRLMLLYSNGNERKSAEHADRILKESPNDEHVMAHLLGGKTAQTSYAQHYILELKNAYPDLPNLAAACAQRMQDHRPIVLPQPVRISLDDLKFVGHKSAGRIPTTTLKRGKHIFPGIGSEKDWQRADKLAIAANALFDMGRFDVAQQKLLEAVDLYGNDGHHLNTFGLCQVKSGDLIGAERAFREAAKVAPDMWPAWDNLARALWFQHRYSEARWAWLQTQKCVLPEHIAANTRKNIAICERQTKETADGGPFLP